MNVLDATERHELEIKIKNASYEELLTIEKQINEIDTIAFDFIGKRTIHFLLLDIKERFRMLSIGQGMHAQTG
jgi:ABC-type uncharacterized transport system ATPase subunit